MITERSTLELGLDRPVRLLHVTDTHLTLTDGRDDERKRSLAESRGYKEAPSYLREHIAYAEANCDLMIHTGDLMDFVSAANVEFSRGILKNEKIFFIAGNHDYSQYVGEAWEDKAYRMNSYMSMGYGLGVPMFFNSRTVGGINIVGIDNSYYLFEEWQLWRLKLEVGKGLPVILVLHDPLFEQTLYDYHRSLHPDAPAYLAGCDEEHLLPYSEFRAVQQRPDAPTLEMIRYIKSEPAVKAVLAGHLHFSFVSELREGLPQYVTGGEYDGTARELTVI